MMEATFHPALVQLRRGQILKVDDARGQTLAVFDGLVWVTQADDPRDEFVSGGGAFSFDRPGVAIVEAFRDSHLAVLAATADYEVEHEAAVA